MSDFRKEDRYRVFKLSDIEAAEQAHPHRAPSAKAALDELDFITSFARDKAGKEPLTCCVVESDWRCYDEVWSLVDAEHYENERRDERVFNHRAWTISYVPKGGPTLAHDWEAVHEDYDGPEDWRALTGSSAADMVEQITTLEADV